MLHVCECVWTLQRPVSVTLWWLHWYHHSQAITHTHMSHALTRAHTHTYTLSHTHSHWHALTNSRMHPHALTHTHTHSRSRSLPYGSGGEDLGLLGWLLARLTGCLVRWLLFGYSLDQLLGCSLNRMSGSFVALFACSLDRLLGCYVVWLRTHSLTHSLTHSHSHSLTLSHSLMWGTHTHSNM